MILDHHRPVLAEQCVDAGTGRIVASALTGREVDGGAQAGPLLTKSRARWPRSSAMASTIRIASVTAPPSTITGHGMAAVIAPPHATAVPSAMAETKPTQRDHHLQLSPAHDGIRLQKAPGHTKRARAEAAVARCKQLIGDGLWSRKDERRATNGAVAAHVLNRVLELERPNYVRTA